MNHPWTTGLDRDQWTDKHTGLLCLAVRGPLGAWCGYVAVPTGHPWHGLAFHDLPRIDVHKGVNYAADGDEDITSGAGQPDGRWWIGFSCDHIGDLVPASYERMGELAQVMCEDTYRDLGYVRREINALAEAVRDAAVEAAR
ncbi:hypothetical protein [Nocardiopsis lucentensis]|uniref:hypothetical protein n=1 Tax=Nocardiopsis lucentensis TaxID=53441 RepID=UPI000346FE08|nr:hypothetical protein [Nocardiopsis lucentensis]